MKVLISSTGKDLESQIDPRFGRSLYSLIIETVNMNIEPKINGFSKNHDFSEIELVQEAIQKGVKVVITGDLCVYAREALENAGITVLENGQGTVKKALKQLMEYEYEEVQFPCT